MTIEGQPSDNTSVTEALVAELAKHTTRVCPIECKTGESLKGETCVADENGGDAGNRVAPQERRPRTIRQHAGSPARRSANSRSDRSRRRKPRVRASRRSPDRASLAAVRW